MKKFNSSEIIGILEATNASSGEINDLIEQLSNLKKDRELENVSKQKQEIQYGSKQEKLAISNYHDIQIKIDQLVDCLENKIDPIKKFPNAGYSKMIKSQETSLTASDKNNPNKRYQIGKHLNTYSSVMIQNGKIVPKLDVYSPNIRKDVYMINQELLDSLSEEEIAIFNKSTLLSKGSVVASNGAVKYPDNFDIAELRGKEVKGFWKEDGSFTIDQKKGTDTLEDEYIMDVDTCKELYKITPQKETKKAYKDHPVYFFKPDNMSIKLESQNKEWLLTDGVTANIAITDTSKKLVVSVVEDNAMGTYADYEKYMKGVNNYEISNTQSYTGTDLAFGE